MIRHGISVLIGFKVVRTEHKVTYDAC